MVGHAKYWFLALLCVGACKTKTPAPSPSATEPNRTKQARTQEPECPSDPLPNPPRIMPPPCAYHTETLAELGDAPGLPAGPLRFALTWSEDSADWLERAPKGETQATLELDLASARAIRVHTPGDTTLPLCQRHVELEIDAHLRTADSVLDSPATARVTIWPTRVDAILELATKPRDEGSLSARAELGDANDVPIRFVLEGREHRVEPGPKGMTTTFASTTPLAVTAQAPLPASAVPGSLTEAALRHGTD